eukprot:gnl/Spiro4/25884_TR12889_c0_g1_i1.p1 gnl/Spiro4/25884_TR12889_c0_g1~~gnl/Spiro4/25884_TR12889_c0_g1_i1.p1  ORF type:complete len:966 (+),score=291.28 gnl/Spiro4/25884_TR12889_c0_g1_i1:74-2971(+)
MGSALGCGGANKPAPTSTAVSGVNGSTSTQTKPSGRDGSSGAGSVAQTISVAPTGSRGTILPDDPIKLQQMLKHFRHRLNGELTPQVKRLEAEVEDQRLEGKRMQISASMVHDCYELLNDGDSIPAVTMRFFEIAGQQLELDMMILFDVVSSDGVVTLKLFNSTGRENLPSTIKTTAAFSQIPEYLFCHSETEMSPAHGFLFNITHCRNFGWTYSPHYKRGLLVSRQTEAVHTPLGRFNAGDEPLLAAALEVINNIIERKTLDMLKDNFLANTSHELRTPLNGIIGIADSLLEQVAGPLSKEHEELLKVIVSSGRRLLALVNDILDFQTLKERELVLKISIVSPVDFIEPTVHMVKTLIVGRAIRLVNQCPKNLPQLKADCNRVQQILINLISSSLRHCDSGTITLSARMVHDVMTLTHDASQEPEMRDFVEFCVHDTGTVIPPEKVATMFVAFHDEEDMGIGLAITKKIVELHMGVISCTSDQVHGTNYTFTLPVANNRDRQERNVAPAAVNPLGEELDTATVEEHEDGESYGQLGDLPPVHILIVDDEPVNLQVLANYFSILNVTVTKAATGIKALEIMERKKFDLVILDVMMPKMSGFDVLKRIRCTFSPAELPVILLTAKNQENDIVTGFGLGANDYCFKPFSKREVISRIKSHIKLSYVNKACTKFVPNEFLQFLKIEDLASVQHGDCRELVLSVLFSDIRSFTTISETMTATDNFRFINDYMRWMDPAIKANQGFIDKFIGDAIMALFGNEQTYGAVDSVQAAIDMCRQVEKFNAERQLEGKAPIDIGIGVNTGRTMMGMVGGKYRISSTVISDHVNLASRVEGLTKLYGARILISEFTLARLSSTATTEMGDPDKRFVVRLVAKVCVKGKTAPTRLYEVINGLDSERQGRLASVLGSFKEAMRLYYSKQWEAARTAFDTVIAATSPPDKPSLMYKDNCIKFQATGVPADWEGIEYPDK